MLILSLPFLQRIFLWVCCLDDLLPVWVKLENAVKKTVLLSKSTQLMCAYVYIYFFKCYLLLFTYCHAHHRSVRKCFWNTEVPIWSFFWAQMKKILQLCFKVHLRKPDGRRHKLTFIPLFCALVLQSHLWPISMHPPSRADSLRWRTNTRIVSQLARNAALHACMEPCHQDGEEASRRVKVKVWPVPFRTTVAFYFLE